MFSEFPSHTDHPVWWPRGPFLSLLQIGPWTFPLFWPQGDVSPHVGVHFLTWKNVRWVVYFVDWAASKLKVLGWVSIGCDCP